MNDESKLIFFTGAPGSRWSGIAKELSTGDNVDNSDWNDERSYNDFTHFGNYFGPEMEFGKKFLHMNKLSKEEILEELNKPYAEPQDDKFRILKSHMFARHLPFIRETFPDSKIVMIYRDNEGCYKWWMKAGGFSITYPSYSWYRDSQVMKLEIENENNGILNFCEEFGVELTATDLPQLSTQLGIVNTHTIVDDWDGGRFDVIKAGVV